MPKLPELASSIPIKTFADHGPTDDKLVNVPQYYAAYVAVRDKARHILARPASKVRSAALTFRLFGGHQDHPGAAAWRRRG